MKTVLTFQPRRLAQAVVMASMMSPTLVLAALPAAAPDAGRLTRELQQPVMPSSPSAPIVLPAQSQERVAPGGLRIRINSVLFSGNTVFSQAELAAVVAPAMGKAYDLAGIYALADQVSEFYRSKGFVFASVFVPENGLEDGKLLLQVVEGRFGQISARDVERNTRREKAAQRYLSPLKSGEVIEQSKLERQMLMLGDLPGVAVTPVMKPGKTVGTGDLEATIERTPRIHGQVNLSNHGNRYTGYHQARAIANIDSPFLFGDQLSASLMSSDERLKSGSLNYSLPLGANGLRANVGYSYTDYRLGREFANLAASGRSQITNIGLSYPLIRSRNSNISVSTQAQHKRFFDEQKTTATTQSRGSDSGTLRLNFDHLDRTGIIYGQVAYTLGRFSSGDPLDLAKTNGNFSYVSADLVRLQRLRERLSVFARVSGQKALNNLDSSESFTLGGPFAVRAYPTGEGTGDEGAFSQVELRYQTTANVVPFVFFDAGSVRLERDRTALGKNGRTLSGAGVGVRSQYKAWSLESTIARRLVGGEPQSDIRDGQYTGWLSVGYAF